MFVILVGLFSTISGTELSGLKILQDSTDFSNFPTITTSLWVRDHYSLKQDDVRFYEEDSLIRSLLVKPEKGSVKAPESKYVLILIENLSSSRGISQTTFFKKVLNTGLRGHINKGDKFLVASFDWFRKGKYVFYHGEYSDDQEYILQQINAITPKPSLGNKQIGGDIYFALDEALKKLAKDKGSLPGNILLLSDDFPNIVSQKTAGDVLRSSLFSNIPIYSVSYFVSAKRYHDVTRQEICRPSYGDYYISSANNSDSCSKMLSSFLDNMNVNSIGKNYKISYVSHLDKLGQKVTIRAEYLTNNAEVVQRYPLNIFKWIQTFPLYSTLLGIATILIILSIYLLINKFRKKRATNDLEVNGYLEQINKTEQQIQVLRAEQERKIEEERLKRRTEEEREKMERLRKMMQSRHQFPRITYDHKGSSGIISIQAPIFSIGREKDNTMPIDSSVVSRHHAEIIYEEDGNFYLVDKGSRNGTFLNESKVDKRIIKDKDRIRIGDVNILFNI